MSFNANEQELRDKYGKLYKVSLDIAVDDDTTERKEYLFRKPSPMSFDRLVKRLSNSATKAAENFVLDNIVEEQEDALRADIEEYPGIVLTINDKLTDMLGLTKDVTVKKF